MSTIRLKVKAGKVRPGASISSSLGFLGLPIAKVIEQINQDTKEFTGLKVDVEVTSESKGVFEVNVLPLTMAMKIRYELNKGKPLNQIVNSLIEQEENFKSFSLTEQKRRAQVEGILKSMHLV